MSVMLGELYKALLEPNEENARKASEEVAGFDAKLSSFETKMEKLQGDMNLLKWMMSTMIVLILFVLGRLITLK